MNKNDLIASVAGSTGLSKADARRAVDGVLDAVRGALASGNAVRLVGFGTFSVVRRAATMGRNPRTGERIHIPASNQPKFKAGKALKGAVLEGDYTDDEGGYTDDGGSAIRKQ